MKRLNGFAQIPLMIALLLMAVAIPIATQLVQQSTENRSQATAPKLSQYDIKHQTADAVKTAIQAKQAAQNAADNPNDASAQRQAAAAADAAKTAQAAADKVRAEATMAAAPTATYYTTTIAPAGSPTGSMVSSTKNCASGWGDYSSTTGMYTCTAAPAYGAVGSTVKKSTDCGSGNAVAQSDGSYVCIYKVSAYVLPSGGPVKPTLTESSGGVSVTITGTIDAICDLPILPSDLAVSACGTYKASTAAGLAATNAIKDYCNLPANSSGAFCNFVKGNIDLSNVSLAVGGSIKTVCSSPLLPVAILLPCGAFNVGYNARLLVGNAITIYCSDPNNSASVFCNSSSVGYQFKYGDPSTVCASGSADYSSTTGMYTCTAIAKALPTSVVDLPNQGNDCNAKPTGPKCGSALTPAPQSGSGGNPPKATVTAAKKPGGGGGNGGSGGSSPTPGAAVCANECPATFSCYGNNGDYKWFATGMPMTGYSLASASSLCVATMPTFKGKAKGDANCDGVIDTYDYSLWHKEFYDGNVGTMVSKNWNADFTGPNGVCDGVVDTYDYSLWHKYFYELMGTN